MYLTRIDLNRLDKGVHYALSDCQRMHRMVMGLFGQSRQEAECLYRLRTEGTEVSLYLYSHSPVLREKLLPSMRLAGERDVSAWLDQMREGQAFRFDLLAMPSQKIAMKGNKNSRRTTLRTEQERLSWLQRKGEQNGFVLLSAQEREPVRLAGQHSAENGGRMYWGAYHYTGALQITDSRLFRQAVSQGVGPGKAYGLGMLLLM